MGPLLLPMALESCSELLSGGILWDRCLGQIDDDGGTP